MVRTTISLPSGRLERVADRAPSPARRTARPHRQQPVALAVDGLEHRGVPADPAGLRAGDHDAPRDGDAERASRTAPRSASAPRAARPPPRRPGRRWPGTAAGPSCRACRSRPATAGCAGCRGTGPARPPTAATRSGRAPRRRPAPRRSGPPRRCSAAARSSTRRPSQSESTASSVVTVPSGSTTSTPPSSRSRAEPNSSSGTRRAVSPRPVSRSNSAHRRSPAMPSGVDRRLGQPLALQRLDRVAPQLEHPHVRPPSSPASRCPTSRRRARGRRRSDAVGQRVRRAGHRLHGEAAPALPVRQAVAAVDLQPRPATRRRRARARPAGRAAAAGPSRRRPAPGR